TNALAAETVREIDDGGVARPAANISGAGQHAARADDIDDDAAPSVAHFLVDDAGDAKIAEQFQFPPFAPAILVDLIERAAGNCAGAIHQDIDASDRACESVARRALREID